MIVNKLYRSIDHFEIEEPGSLIDVVNRAEKRGLITSSEVIREIKELRNEIAHEYVVHDLKDLFGDTLRLTPILEELSLKAIAYSEQQLKR